MMLTLSTPALGETDHDWTQTVQDHLDIYSILSERRDPGEEAVLRGQTLFIKYRRDLRQLTTDKKNLFLCQATAWLLTGRLHESKGLEALLRRKQEITQVKLIIFNVSTSVTPNAQGKYTQKKKLGAQLILTIERKRLAQLNLTQLKENLKGQTCERVAKTVLTKVWFADEI